MPLFLGGAAAVAAAAAGLRSAGAFYAGAPQLAQKGTAIAVRRLPVASPAIPVLRSCAQQSVAMSRPGPLKWLLGGLAGMGLMRMTRPTASKDAELSKPGLRVVAMRTMGGRRKRLGIPCRSCMLTGRHKYKIIKRGYTEKKNKVWWKPNCGWKDFWWEKEKKWVRLFVSAAAIKKVDVFGLDKVATDAGLDLYAWSKPHWEAGSKQPLCLKVGFTLRALKHKKYWRNYKKLLNQGKALADIYPEAGSQNPRARLMRKKFKAWTPPDDSSTKPPGRLDVPMTSDV
jgi:ribosomal protein L28